MPLPILLAALAVTQAEFPKFEAREIDPHVGNVCYAVTSADVDGDGKPDVVAVTEDAVVWYRNPDWARTDIIRGVTARDNVCLQPHDIDGDGRVDFALGAGWRPPDTNAPSTLQWIGRDAEGKWQLHSIDFDEPMIHRIRFADVKGAGKPQLIVAPLQGRTTEGPDWGEGPGVNLLAFTIPADPTSPEWPSEVIEDSLHTVHNIWPVNFDADPRSEVIAAAWEGVFLLDLADDGTWTTTKLGTGEQETSPNKGASEIKAGRLADGTRYIATIEPWHGHKAVVYWPKPGEPMAFTRHVIDEPLAWGHAVWCADLDGDGDDELILGQRDPNAAGVTPKGPGVRVYDFSAEPSLGRPFSVARHVIDDGGMACEDAIAVDLDDDGRPEIVAGGRATHNVKIYWNRGR